MDFSNYAVEDFILDETFQSYYLDLDPQHVAFWEKWIQDHPEKNDAVVQAKRALNTITTLYKTSAGKILPGNHQQIRAVLEKNLTREQPISTRMREPQRSRLATFIKRGVPVAAVLLLLMISIVAYHWYTTRPAEQVQYVTRYNTAGQRSDIYLSDGTRVILNASSKLIYPGRFSKDSREITLIGEAFFDVAKDAARPFKVTSGALVTTALGTSFNIRSDSAYVQVALVSGKVEVKNRFSKEAMQLIPGEATVLNAGASLQKEQFDKDEVLSWKDDILYFHEADMNEIVRKLENWYGVDIEVEGTESSERHFTGKFKDESLNNILRLLSYSRNFTYKYEPETKKVILKFTNP